VNRDELVRAGTRAILSDRMIYGLPAATHAAADACAVLNAILPQVSTVAELEALPVWTKVLDRNGDVWWRTHHSWDTFGDQRQQAQQWPARYVIESVAPLTVVWTPDEVTA
jgi:hypothetical protein